MASADHAVDSICKDLLEGQNWFAAGAQRLPRIQGLLKTLEKELGGLHHEIEMSNLAHLTIAERYAAKNGLTDENVVDQNGHGKSHFGTDTSEIHEGLDDDRTLYLR